MRRFITTFAAGLAAGIAFVVACGVDPTATADAGSTTCDCPAPKEPRVVSVNCDKEQARDPAGVSRFWHWFAEIPLSGEGVSDVEAVVVCDRTEIAEGSASARCEGGETCTGYAPADDTCRSARWRYADDRLVVECGEAEGRDGPDGELAQLKGERFGRAIVRLRR